MKNDFSFEAKSFSGSLFFPSKCRLFAEDYHGKRIIFNQSTHTGSHFNYAVNSRETTFQES